MPIQANNGVISNDGAYVASPELSLLGRYQRGLLWGGGVGLSTIILIASFLAIWLHLKDYISEGEIIYQSHKALLLLNIDSKQASVQRSVINAELLWSDHHKPSEQLLRDFVVSGCRAVVQANSDVIPQLVLGQAPRKCSGVKYADYLALAELRGYAISANARQRRIVPSAYFYDLDKTFIAIMPPPKFNDPVKTKGATDVSNLIQKIASDIGDLNDSGIAKNLHESRKVTWLPPARDPFTGEEVIKLVQPAFEGDRPFAVLVSNMAIQEWLDRLRQVPYDGNFIILDVDGRRILSAWHDTIIDPGLTQRVIDSKNWQKDLHSAKFKYTDGDFIFSEYLSDTGWILIYAYSWRTILAASWPMLVSYAAGTLIVLSTLWILLLLFNRKVFTPVYLRSLRVFESENLNRTIIATAPIGLSLLSARSGEVLLENGIMRSYDNDATSLRRQFLDLYWAKIPLPENAQDYSLVGHDLAITSADGTVSHLLANLIKAKYQGLDVLLCSFSDITAHKRLQQKQEEEREVADAASRAKSAFLATMSHEIRTPLNGILGNLELLERTELTVMQLDRLHTVTSSSKALLTIINDILDFSKVESGQMTLENIQFDVIDVVEQAAIVFAPLADIKGLNLFYTVTPGLPRFYFGDPARLRQVLLNLLSNAIKFTDDGHVSILVGRRAVGADGRSALLTISVSDTGIGIAAAQRSELFKPFSQGDASVSRRFGGSGLGLALCKRLIEMMGGAIALDSSRIAGSTFTISVPLQIDADAPGLDGPFVGAPNMVMLCSSTEWSASIGDQLRHWGLNVQTIADPREMPAAFPLLIFGEPRSWTFDDEDRACEQALWVIDAIDEGPRVAAVSGKRSVVSCYSLDGLRTAIAQALAQETIVDSIARNEAVVRILPAAQSVRVLVVEDHKVNLALISDQLDTLGYQADLTDSGSAALELFAKNQYDIVFTDLSMPGMDGYMLSNFLRRRGALLPIIAITAHTSVEEHRRCKQVGITDVLLKPMSLEEIDQIICRHVKNRIVSAAANIAGLEKPVLGANLLRTLRTTNAAAIATINRALAMGDIRVIEEQLHSIKGVYSMIQEPNVVAVCVRLEHLARAVDLRDLTAALSKFETLLDDVLPSLEQPAASH